MHRQILTAVLSAILVVAVENTVGDLNDRPVIGILAQRDSSKDADSMYIAASYVKFVESAGARVVPVLSNLTEGEYSSLFHSLNGLLMPGGAVSISTSGYAKAANIFYALSKEAFAHGDTFPIWGTCLGFEMLTVMAAGKNVLIRVDADDVNLALNFTAGSSRLFGTLPPTLVQALETKPLTYNHHLWGAMPHSFASDSGLAETFNVVTTSRDNQGLEFVSTIEGKTLPLFGTQWHSEKNAFEWNSDEHIGHDPDSMRVMHHLADTFVSTARLSQHRFVSTAETDARLIYNFLPIYSGQHGSHFEQVYAWPLRGNATVDADSVIRNLNSLKFE